MLLEVLFNVPTVAADYAYVGEDSIWRRTMNLYGGAIELLLRGRFYFYSEIHDNSLSSQTSRLILPPWCTAT